MNSDRNPAFLILLVWGAVLALAVYFFPVPYRLPDFSYHIFWYLGRSSGFIAYWLLFASVALGLAVSSRVFDGVLGRPWVFDVHKFLSIFVLIVMAFHALIFLPDPYANYKLNELLIPFKSHYRGFAVGVGILALYGSVIVSVSFYLKRFIGQKGWQLLHYLTFLLFIGAMGHGIWSGTDSGKPIVQISYLASGIGILFLSIFRILVTRAAGGRPRPAIAAPAAKPAGVALAQPAGTTADIR